MISKLDVRGPAEGGIGLGAWLLNTATSTAGELYDAMLEIYPDRVNPGSLWSAANILRKNT